MSEKKIPSTQEINNIITVRNHKIDSISLNAKEVLDLDSKLIELLNCLIENKDEQIKKLIEEVKDKNKNNKK